jgi:hypothetical protein
MADEPRKPVLPMIAKEDTSLPTLLGKYGKPCSVDKASPAMNRKSSGPQVAVDETIHLSVAEPTQLHHGDTSKSLGLQIPADEKVRLSIVEPTELHHRDTSEHLLESAFVPSVEQQFEYEANAGIKSFLEHIDLKCQQYLETSEDPDIAIAQPTETISKDSDIAIALSTEAPSEAAADILHSDIDDASESLHTVPSGSFDLRQLRESTLESEFPPLTHGVRETMCTGLGLSSFSVSYIHACLGLRGKKLAIQDSDNTMAMERSISRELTSEQNKFDLQDSQSRKKISDCFAQLAVQDSQPPRASERNISDELASEENKPAIEDSQPTMARERKISEELISEQNNLAVQDSQPTMARERKISDELTAEQNKVALQDSQPRKASERNISDELASEQDKLAIQDSQRTMAGERKISDELTSAVEQNKLAVQDSQPTRALERNSSDELASEQNKVAIQDVQSTTAIESNISDEATSA